jgi:hypothetical protein
MVEINLLQTPVDLDVFAVSQMCFVLFLPVLRLELRAYTLTHSTSPFL